MVKTWVVAQKYTASQAILCVKQAIEMTAIERVCNNFSMRAGCFRKGACSLQVRLVLVQYNFKMKLRVYAFSLYTLHIWSVTKYEIDPTAALLLSSRPLLGLITVLNTNIVRVNYATVVVFQNL